MGDVAPLVTLSGPPASGTTTLGTMLADEFSFEVLNGGAIFREMAASRGMTLAEFTDLAEVDPAIDRELDRRLTEQIDTHLNGRRHPGGERLLVESRLAGWHADGRATLSVWLDAPLRVRSNRLGERVETPRELGDRERSDAERYREYYGIDITDLSVYDLVVDTDTFSEECMFRTSKSAIECV